MNVSEDDDPGFEWGTLDYVHLIERLDRFRHLPPREFLVAVAEEARVYAFGARGAAEMLYAAAAILFPDPPPADDRPDGGGFQKLPAIEERVRQWEDTWLLGISIYMRLLRQAGLPAPAIDYEEWPSINLEFPDKSNLTIRAWLSQKGEEAMRETPTPERLRHLREEVGRAASDMEAARQTLHLKRQQLAEAACPWQPGDFVRPAEIEVPGSYRVARVMPGDPESSAGSEWSIEVSSAGGNRYIWESMVTLERAEPWEDQAHG